MGRMQYWMNVSMDLRIQAVDGAHGGGGWVRIGAALHEEFNARARELAVMVEGRLIHEIMEPFWPLAAEDESEEPVMREYGRIWTDKPKVLVSNTRTEAGHNTRIIGGDDAIEQLAALRAETDGVIGVGGANVATQLLRAGLLDELLLFVHPVVLGAGRPLFDEGAPRVECDLLEHREFEDGVVLNRYAVRGARPA
ncbi:MAG: bifunctional deaminase-reductase protein [Thermoleophilia bacterium]|nr:bifunctional deaminase-reductase protein [Thermoleophilia bacterium]